MYCVLVRVTVRTVLTVFALYRGKCTSVTAVAVACSKRRRGGRNQNGKDP